MPDHDENQPIERPQGARPEASHVERAEAIAADLERIEKRAYHKRVAEAPRVIRSAVDVMRAHARELDSLRARLEIITRHLEGRTTNGQ